jgi:hypothetical protein
VINIIIIVNFYKMQMNVYVYAKLKIKLLNRRIDVFKPEIPTFTLYEFCEYFYLNIYATYQ